MTIKTRDVIGYVTLPRILPRLMDLLPDIRMFAGLIAQIFGNVRLLPPGHPFLAPAAYGHFGLKSVLAEAARNLKPELRNIDQYLIYTAFVLGIIILLAQFALVIMLLFVSAANAAIPFVSMFVTVNTPTDIGYLMLDRVFGIPGFFKSCYDPVINAMYSGPGGACYGFIAPNAFPTPFQRGLQALFKFYSNAMLIVALLIVVYYFFALLVESVGTGVPLGRRFQSFYTPIRLVLAVMLMLPLAYGYNTGQYMTLIIAKWGSSFATNSWLVFNNKTGDNPLGLQVQNLAAKPRTQDMTSVINFMYLVKACQAAYAIAYDGTIPIQPYFVPSAASGPVNATLMSSSSSFSSTLNLFKKSNISIVFGHQSADYSKYPGEVKPYCGQITIPVQSYTVTGVPDIYAVHFNFIRNLWYFDDLFTYGAKMAYIVKFADKLNGAPLPSTTIGWDAHNEAPAGTGFYVDLRLNRQAAFNADMNSAIATVRSTYNSQLAMDQAILNLGWGGAGLWFNKVASFNGAMTDAVFVMPTPTKYPLVMEFVRQKKSGQESGDSYKDRFSLTTSHKSSKSLSIDDFASGEGLNDPATDMNIASLLDVIYKTIANSETTAKPQMISNKSPLKAFVGFIFGETGLFDLMGNDEVFPLARMAMLGRSIIDKTIVMIGGGALLMGAGGLIGGLNEAAGGATAAVGDAILGMAMMSLSVGFILYYLIPFFPFIYFFMAVGRWVKAIFEAMVGVPLWALAHLRLGGDGIAGPAAAQGYLMLLEIALRPIFTLFGLLAALTVFAALAATLDTIFALLVYNVGGFDLTNLSSKPAASGFAETARESLDELFYTVFYAIILYMMAMACFKLIDLIPSKVMRYLGASVQTFGDRAGDPAENLVQYVAYAGHEIGDEMKGIVTGLSGGLGKAGGAGIKAARASSKMAEKMRDTNP